MVSWILSLMLMLQPNAPWKDTYNETAKAIAENAEKTPLFEGPEGKKQTAALLVSLAWFESRFNQKAIGDKGKSFGLYQQQGMGEIADAEISTRVAISQIKTSFRICSNKPIEARLAWYAAGRDACKDGNEKGVRESNHRMLKAFWLLRKFPLIEKDN